MAQEPGFAADSGTGGNVRQRNFQRKMRNSAGAVRSGGLHSRGLLKPSTRKPCMPGTPRLCHTRVKNRRLFSPEIFSAGFKALPGYRKDQAAHLLSANLFAEQRAGACPTTRNSRVSGGPWTEFPNK